VTKLYMRIDIMEGQALVVENL